MTVTHTFVSAVSDSTDDTLVRPSNWNADHEVIDALTILSSAGAAADTQIQRESAGVVAITSSSTAYRDLKVRALLTDNWTDQGNNSQIAGRATLAGVSLCVDITRGLGINSGKAVLWADANYKLTLGNSTNAQGFFVYNTTDGDPITAPTNYERGVFDWTTTANVLTIGAQNGGTGSGRAITIVSGGNPIKFRPAGTDAFSVIDNGLIIGPAQSFSVGGNATNGTLGDVGIRYGGSSGLMIVNDGQYNSSVYRDLKLRNLTITATATSTASSGFVTVSITSLPTTDPGVTGSLWMSSGVVRIST